ncbi:hypothetical protein SAMN05216567_115142 [Variovorax sp. OK605]|jgi:hypothetical protein|uniref:hypothetical protein n=1 Tax=Variovorax sp. OK605 TaxID=1855317 RepID=UPI0008E0E51A|nr:hypothetical protein [Variovorax sp. OK605]SFQ41373.1 hypothetical protein SAMN05216567_115142 [Variovorax sp. OK605]
MDFPIVSLACIEREAKEAAEKGHSLSFACPYPFDDPAGGAFKRVFNEHRVALRSRNNHTSHEVRA